MEPCLQGTVLQRVAGKDASKQFWKYHNESILKKYQGQLQVGSLDSKPKPVQAPTPPATPPPAEKKEVAVPRAESGTLGVEPQAAPEEAEAMDQFVSAPSRRNPFIENIALEQHVACISLVRCELQGLGQQRRLDVH